MQHVASAQVIISVLLKVLDCLHLYENAILTLLL